MFWFANKKYVNRTSFKAMQIETNTRKKHIAHKLKDMEGYHIYFKTLL